MYRCTHKVRGNIDDLYGMSMYLWKWFEELILEVKTNIYIEVGMRKCRLTLCIIKEVSIYITVSLHLMET